MKKSRIWISVKINDEEYLRDDEK
jgi:hypothetical protein